MSLPDAASWRQFTHRLLNASGVGSLAAGVIFFVAANWTQYGLMGRFAIVQAALLVAVGLAYWRPPPAILGESNVALATLLTGALLALFGQSYQTGADLYELFFVWALLAMPFALASRTGATWAIWWVVLNVGLALLCGLQEASLMRWMWRGTLGLERSTIILLAGLVSIVGAAVFVRVGPPWVARVPNTFGFAFGAVAGVIEPYSIATVGFAIVSAVVAAFTIRRKDDVYPMALICAAWIAISTAVLIKAIHFNDLGSFFIVAVWLIATSTAAGFLLMGWVRAWRK